MRLDTHYLLITLAVLLLLLKAARRLNRGASRRERLTANYRNSPLPDAGVHQWKAKFQRRLKAYRVGAALVLVGALAFATWILEAIAGKDRLDDELLIAGAGLTMLGTVIAGISYRCPRCGEVPLRSRRQSSPSQTFSCEVCGIVLGDQCS
jgi:predicted RNA-binding Zn-ribbon protein involved in translation (DUF1610 family)